ncbi:MAG: IS200/IS605 family transposase [Candidatus Limivicinus sp.]|jgi:putative transposase
MKSELKQTAHSSYRCEYHIVFALKYRRKVIYKELRKDIGEIFRKLCSEMKVEIIEAEAYVDHIHMLVTIPPCMSVAQFLETLKSKSALMIFDRHANLKYKYGSRNFWRRGYYVDTVGKNAKIIQKYIRNQLEKDFAADQIPVKYMEPFTGERV